MKNSSPVIRKLYLLAIAALLINSVYAYDLVVAQDGSGNYTTVQAAINAAPVNGTVVYTIFIKNGRYKEKITVPSNKPFLQLVGESVANVILTYDDYAGKMTACAATVGTQNSASFSVNANDFSAINITFENSHSYGYPDNNGQQAVAILVNADRAAFKNCRFLGNQDTMYLKGSGNPRSYFKNCYIDGIVDFIFGSSIALFDSCVVNAKTRTGITSSYITAPNTPTGQSYGFIFRDARLPDNTGTTAYFLSRPWASPTVADTRQKCVFLSSRLSGHIQPAGWSIWDANTVTSNLYYGEYNSRYFNGNAADISARVSWSYQLSQADSATYTFANLFGTWDPCSVAAGFCAASATDIAVSNFRGVKGGTSSQFDWNISWPVAGIQYTLYRSADNISYSAIYSTTATNDTAINFSYTDPVVPASGNTYYYYVSASKAGYATHNTEVVTISNAPSVVVNASDALNLCGFSQTIGSPSATQTFTVTGSNLTGNVIITPPANFEVSSNNTTWYTNASPLSLAPASGSVATTAIYVRLNATSAGSYSGNIANASTGAVSQNVAVSGVAINAPVINSTVIQQWPLTANNTDDAAVRSAYVAASSSTLNRLTLSNGTTQVAVPAYSATYGQAFGASTNGDGTWTTAVGGPGGNLTRVHYVQFTVTASGRSLRIDSLVAYTAFNGTSSGTKMAVVYSKTGFTTSDSTEISGGVDQSNTAVTGSFATPILLANQTGGPTNYYRLALNGATGVTLADGQTLTMRLYYACSSTGTPRYAMLKNVSVKGEALGTFPLNLISFTGSYTGNVTNLAWTSVNEINIARYQVERRVNGTDFTPSGSVIANGSVNYRFTDKDPAEGFNYYRLKIYSKDGSSFYSRVVQVNTKAKAGISIYPNPVKDQLTLCHPRAGSNAVVKFFSIEGKETLSYKVQPSAIQTTLNVTELVKGYYLAIYTDEETRLSFKFIKQ
jgi:pectin methylesterase-like acyl-CoA thioesterase